MRWREQLNAIAMDCYDGIRPDNPLPWYRLTFMEVESENALVPYTICCFDYEMLAHINQSRSRSGFRYIDPNWFPLPPVHMVRGELDLDTIVSMSGEMRVDWRGWTEYCSAAAVLEYALGNSDNVMNLAWKPDDLADTTSPLHKLAVNQTDSAEAIMDEWTWVPQRISKWPNMINIE